VRYSHASILLERGVAIPAVPERMGYSSVRTTADIYSHALRSKDKEAAEIFGQVMDFARAKKHKDHRIGKLWLEAAELVIEGAAMGFGEAHAMSGEIKGAVQ